MGGYWFFLVFGKDCFVPRNDGGMWVLSPALSEGEGDVSGLVMVDCGGGLLVFSGIRKRLLRSSQ